jgi:hypothetical protein
MKFLMKIVKLSNDKRLSSRIFEVFNKRKISKLNKSLANMEKKEILGRKK